MGMMLKMADYMRCISELRCIDIKLDTVSIDDSLVGSIDDVKG